MLVREDPTREDIQQAWADLWPHWQATAHHSGQRAHILREYNQRFDEWLDLTRTHGPMHQRIHP